jgi:hypothetical protein
MDHPVELVERAGHEMHKIPCGHSTTMVEQTDSTEFM